MPLEEIPSHYTGEVATGVSIHQGQKRKLTSFHPSQIHSVRLVHAQEYRLKESSIPVCLRQKRI